MRHQKLLVQTVCLTFVLLLPVGCGAPATTATPKPTPTPTSTPTPTQIPTPTPTPTATPGTSLLTASAPGLGMLEFGLDLNSMSIFSLGIKFSHFSCGSFDQRVNEASISFPKGQPITAGQFTISSNALNIFGISLLTITGTFDGTYKHASGTWKVDSGGTSCQGTWKA